MPDLFCDLLQLTELSLQCVSSPCCAQFGHFVFVVTVISVNRLVSLPDSIGCLAQLTKLFLSCASSCRCFRVLPAYVSSSRLGATN